MDFDTTPGGRRRQGPGSLTNREHRPIQGLPSGSTGIHRPYLPDENEEAFRIPAGARKAALVHLALEVWRVGELDPRQLGEVRGRDVDEARLLRALYRSSMGEIEHALGPALKGRRVLVEGRLAGTDRTAIGQTATPSR